VGGRTVRPEQEQEQEQEPEQAGSTPQKLERGVRETEMGRLAVDLLPFLPPRCVVFFSLFRSHGAVMSHSYLRDPFYVTQCMHVLPPVRTLGHLSMIQIQIESSQVQPSAVAELRC